MTDFDFRAAMEQPVPAARMFVMFGYSATAIVDYLVNQLGVPHDEAEEIERDARTRAEAEEGRGIEQLNALAIQSEFDLSVNINQEDT